MPKTPSPKVIAAAWILSQLEIPAEAPNAVTSVSPQSLFNLAGSRVNDAKAEKVKTQIAKITAKLVQRMQAVMDKFAGKATAKADKTAKPAAPSKGGTAKKAKK